MYSGVNYINAKSSGDLSAVNCWVSIIPKPISRKDPKCKKKKIHVHKEYTAQRFIDEILDEFIDPYVGKVNIYTDKSKSYRISMMDTIEEVYEKHVSNDGQLYIYYTVDSSLCPCT